MSLSWMKNWIGGDTHKPPERSESTIVTEALMSELDFHIKECQRLDKEKQLQQQKKSMGVDYSWLISTTTKPYLIPQIERLELEELCANIKPVESGRVISQFRQVISREPNVQEIPKILKAVVTQVLNERPMERQKMSDWVQRRASSLSNIRVKPSTRVSPISYDHQLQRIRETRTHSLPEFSRNTDHLPV